MLGIIARFVSRSCPLSDRSAARVCVCVADPQRIPKIRSIPFNIFGVPKLFVPVLHAHSVIHATVQPIHTAFGSIPERRNCDRAVLPFQIVLVLVFSSCALVSASMRVRLCPFRLCRGQRVYGAFECVRYACGTITYTHIVYVTS